MRPSEQSQEQATMRIKFTRRTAGSIPSEVLVEIPTVTGSEEVIVHVSQVDDIGVEVGFIGRRDNTVLAELPRETMTGRWRVWVSESEVTWRTAFRAEDLPEELVERIARTEMDPRHAHLDRLMEPSDDEKPNA
jgi:hypothetical protein